MANASFEKIYKEKKTCLLKNCEKTAESELLSCTVIVVVKAG